MKPYYEDESVQLFHGTAEDVLPTINRVDHFITDPPYSEHVHGAVRSAKMLANDRGGRYGADTRRQVNLGFEHLTDELRDFLSAQAARLTARWVLVFSDTEGAHLWAEALEAHGLDYVRTGAWIKRGSTPQFSGDRPATGFEAITICHPKGRKRWNGGGCTCRLGCAYRPEPVACSELGAGASDAEAVAVDVGAGGAVHRPRRGHLRPYGGFRDYRCGREASRPSRGAGGAGRGPLRVGCVAVAAGGSVGTRATDRPGAFRLRSAFVRMVG